MQTIIRSPAQASHIFGTHGAPRQRHLFLVRFFPNAQTGYLAKAPGLTFVVKHTDRPKVSIKTEEMNQYNKKRQIYTGFKHESIKMTFWDSADGTAQNMWRAYAEYYFGDFVPSAETGYRQYDVTTDRFHLPGGGGYGLTEGYGLTGAGLNSAQWFFPKIDIIHFYNGLYDQYSLINPRITSYDPDELDYETAAVSQINMTFVYENLQYLTGQKVTGSKFDEFVSGNFFGNPVKEANIPFSDDTATYSSQTPSNPGIGNLLANPTSVVPADAPFRAVTAMESGNGALSPFGNFSFGAPSAATVTNGASLSGPKVDVAGAGVAQNLASSQGTTGTQMLQSVLANNQPPIGGQSYVPPTAYSAFNANQTGTCQIGFNNNYALTNGAPPVAGLGPPPTMPPPGPQLSSPYTDPWQV